MRARAAAVVALAVLIGVAALLAPSAGAESSTSSYANRLVSLINNARAQNGLKALTVTSGTSTVAANWTNHLDQQQALSHNPDLGHQLETHGSPDWTAYGENVGDGPTSSADTLFKAYMNSPEHRDNILGSRFRYLGIGVVFDGSTAWNTLDFVDQYSSSKPHTTSTTSAPPKPRPRSTTTPPKAVAKPATAVRRAGATQPAATQKTAASRRLVAAPRHIQVRGLSMAAPATVPASPPVAKAAAALPAALPMPPAGRDTAPYLAAAAAILLVVATRFVVEVLPRGAVTAARVAR